MCACVCMRALMTTCAPGSGDAMTCVYTLGQLNGTVVDSNLCHDVRAYMNGGCCLSQDLGSSSVTFSNNVCLRVTGTPHNTHYGVNLTYTNSIFWGGYYDSWVAGNVSSAGALRTSSNIYGTCGSVDYPTACRCSSTDSVRVHMTN